MYFRTWVASDKRYGSAPETESNLLKAIFTAAGRSETEVEAYQQLGLSGKESKLREVMADFDRLGAQMNRARDEANQRAATDSKKRADDTKDLDKNIFILEKRLQREKLSYEKEYELTQQLKQLKERQRVVTAGNSTNPLNNVVATSSPEYTRLLIAAWSSFFLVSHFILMFGKNSENVNLIYKIEMTLRNIDSSFKVRGPPFYTGIFGT